ncbi:MAG: ATP-dependent Lon protease, partial [Thermoplasmata archaeon]|nr:ATP-dependent Lon protease [Thermoplasmata archaeon]
MADSSSPGAAANGVAQRIAPPQQWIQGETFETTADVPVPEKLMDQVIGQDHAVTVVRKAAEQKRHVMLIGDPGTGKSMLARAMTEFLPKEELEDVIAYPNQEDNNTPRIRVVPAGKGKEIVDAQKFEARKRQEQRSVLINILTLGFIGIGIYLALTYKSPMYFLLSAGLALLMFLFSRNPAMGRTVQMVPKLLVGHDPDEVAPFIDATAAHSGALLGDVRHDPFQAGGLETPAHERVEAGAIHKAHRGVLYIDEINTLHLQSQQHLLT